MKRMDIEKAQQMMADAVKAMLECGQFQAAHTVATRTRVGGEFENVTCLIFGRTPEVLGVIADRIGDASIDERVAALLARDALAQAAKR